jgi:excisionase family DNA binding protein
MPNSLQSRPVDATLSVTKAARLLGVHPNTIRTWSDAGRLRYFRINARGDRRYRLGDLQRFLRPRSRIRPARPASLSPRPHGATGHEPRRP